MSPHLYHDVGEPIQQDHQLSVSNPYRTTSVLVCSLVSTADIDTSHFISRHCVLMLATVNVLPMLATIVLHQHYEFAPGNAAYTTSDLRLSN